MKKTVLILILIVFSNFFIQSCGQSSYRIKSFADKGDFIFPPLSRLKSSCKIENGKKIYTVKKSCRYQYVAYIDSLKTNRGDYYSFLNSLNSAWRFSSKDSIDKICFDTDCYICDNTKVVKKKSFNKAIRKPSSKTIAKLQNELIKNISAGRIAPGSKICDIVQAQDTINKFWKIKYSYDKKAFLLQIDYGRIIDNQTEDTIQKRFIEMAQDLLVEFNRREVNGAENFNWPTSSSQNVVEKIFEIIPIPQKASLARYICKIDDDKSYVLLNPKIKLKVDAVEKVKDGNDWHFNLVGTTFISINRNDNGNIIQTPFLKFNGNLPNNELNNNTKNILQASTGDIQLSNTLQDCPFVFLHQKNFKKNNKKATGGDTDCYNTDDKPTDCNSVLFHFKTLTEGSLDCEIVKKEKGGGRYCDINFEQADYKSSFGNRNLITPIITIILNSIFFEIPLNTNLDQLRSQIDVPSDIKIYRSHNGVYKKIKIKSTNSLILLPNDKIVF